MTQNTRQNQKFFQEALSKWIFGQLETEKRKLQSSHAKRIPAIAYGRIKSLVSSLASNVIDVEQLAPHKRKELFALTKLESHLGTDFMNQVAASYTSQRAPGRHHAHRGFKPSHKRKKRAEHWD